MVILRGSRPTVLNAFRHQRKGYHGAREGHEEFLVLNAFRHQRKGYKRTNSASSFAVSCSTPFGIKGKDTDGRARGLARTNVLNAFRHQRKGYVRCRRWSAGTRPGAQRLSASKERIREFGLLSTTRNSRCSTPFGIKGKDTVIVWRRESRANVLNAFRHQRKGYGLAIATPMMFVAVLNAFRHQRKGYSPTRNRTAALLRGAQRLSASKERIPKWVISCYTL